jgi:predicted NAD/FAD-binding protein
MTTDAPHFAPSGRTSTSPHIGIVGAGVSGLRSAEILLEHEFKVTILEARDRIGGRVIQLKPSLLTSPKLMNLQICQSDKLGYTADM